MSISIVLPTLHGMGWNAADRRERWNPKRCGELSEAAFLLKATEQGFLVAKPWGDSERYDFIVDSGTRLWRVQLKSTAVLQQRGYHVNMMHNAYVKGKVGYSAELFRTLSKPIIRQPRREQESRTRGQEPIRLPVHSWRVNESNFKKNIPSRRSK